MRIGLNSSVDRQFLCTPRLFHTDCGRRSAALVAVLLLIFTNLFSASSLAVEQVRAQLGKESAWAGEAVPLIITLYSPGPFSGTASFELPDLPRTAIVTGGRPIVGSE